MSPHFPALCEFILHSTETCRLMKLALGLRHTEHKCWREKKANENREREVCEIVVDGERKLECKSSLEVKRYCGIN